MKFPIRIASASLALFALGCFALPARASAATEIYYSVGSDTTTNYLTGSNVTVTIDGSGNATFSAVQTASSTGVGDIVTYGGSRAFITGKTSTSIWTVETATGGIPAATTSAPVASITHAFSSLKAAVGSYVAGNATSTNFLNTSDLVTGNYILNIPCYNDNGTPETTDGNMTIGGFTTGPSNYINIYTPTSTATQANASQRHTGTYDTTHGYAIQVAVNAAVLTISTGYVRIDGIQIHNVNGKGEMVYGNNINPSDVYLSNSILYGSSNPPLYDRNTGSSFHFWNNLFIGTTGGSEALDIGSSYATSTIYNNTFYNFKYGVNIGNVSPFPIFVNNLFASTTDVFPFAHATPASGSDYNSTATSSIDYGGTHPHDVVNATYSFVDAPNGNFDLNSSDTGAKDLGTSSPATDQYYPFSTDILGNARPYGSAWDIGAFEYTPTADTIPPVISGISVSTTTSTATVSWTTNEAASSTVYYGATSSYGSASTSDSFVTSHSIVISSLAPSTTYHYEIGSVDASHNVATTSDATFTTAALPVTAPIVTTSSAGSVSTAGATLDGSISSYGNANATQSGFAYGTASDLSTVIATTTDGAQTGNASFSHVVSSATCGTTYYFRAYATNTAGTGYGAIATFSTTACAAASTPSATAAEPVYASGLGSGSSAYTAPLFAPGYGPSATPTTGAVPTPVAGLTALAPISMHIGSYGTNVLTLQRILNSHGYPVASAGPGSPGHETDYFGPATTKAVEAFQLRYGIAAPGDAGYGIAGPTTRAIMNELVAGHMVFRASAGAAAAPAAQSTASIPAGLYEGVTTSKVRDLQIFLNSHGFTVAAAGPGSTGHETDFFGPATKKAVEAFQLRYGIAAPGKLGYGMVGPVTSAKIDSLEQAP